MSHPMSRLCTSFVHSSKSDGPRSASKLRPWWFHDLSLDVHHGIDLLMTTMMLLLSLHCCCSNLALLSLIFVEKPEAVRGHNGVFEAEPASLAERIDNTPSVIGKLGAGSTIALELRTEGSFHSG